MWYGGTTAHIQSDPAHTIQGVITGIGFLCAGVIMKDGMSVRGLTTAASIWAVAATGVLLGVGFYAAALLLAVLCVASMSLMHPLESRLPGRMTLDLSLTFQPREAPDLNLVIELARSRGYRVLNDTLTITYADHQAVWRVSLVAPDKARALSPAALAAEMAATEGVSRFSIVPVRS
ncbi:MgtC/SapB family protein [Cupriavidus sp. D384]|uniref:MgtC/SapB family protein n=1 Tax=Cupriavidus sp. D384 TaxID=1538095 RepID=UPI0026F4312C|nr:MgtC/SapB family protein [Cupriavidus sp. D384]